MKKKILIIEDELDDFEKIKAWIETNPDYSVIPENYSEVSEALYGIKGDTYNDFIIRQIITNYREIGLILCDIKIKDTPLRGCHIVEDVIRQMSEKDDEFYPSINPPYWTSMVPILGMTKYPKWHQLMLKAGAEYIVDKSIFPDIKKIGSKDNTAENKNDNKDISAEKENELNILRAIIDVQIKKFEKNLQSFYPNRLVNKITKIKLMQNGPSAFIMIDFRHLNFANVVKGTLKEYGITGLTANVPGGRYAGQLWDEIATHAHGCDFGIAIYVDDTGPDSKGKTRDNKMNPNVSVEVGYMLGLKKNVLFFKHKSIDKLPSDFSSENYAEFENDNSLRESLITLLTNRGFKKINSTTSE